MESTIGIWQLVEIEFSEKESENTWEALCENEKKAGIEDSRCVDGILWFRGDMTTKGLDLEDGGETLEGWLDNSKYEKTTSWNITCRLTNARSDLRSKQRKPLYADAYPRKTHLIERGVSLCEARADN